ncbi:hypothetical protein DCAR_0418294 [Daucus carota subsp. sativus]|uniref:Uncharacterized protein n=1 Tax=Daucus carota subsp. sativus TaxID=79200 RepID=A0A165ZAU5_DAUCS|nr:PREDICTED: uncharacterized protein LOC108217696 [Daucus carota subsp. sativus]WOG98948.1 hypothetical protein DCAR_0418294 [Daucus carota subsp. sativus]
MGGGKREQNKLLRILTLPIRFLKKGRDLYVKSMMDVAHKPRYATTRTSKSRNKSSQPSSALPKSFSTSFTPSWANNLHQSDDLRELIRANSTAYNNDPTNQLRKDMELYIQQLVKEQKVQKLKESLMSGNVGKFSISKEAVPRSCSVGMGKIDEETALEEGDDEEEEGGIYVKKNEVKFPRSRSHAVTQTNGVF